MLALLRAIEPAALTRQDQYSITTPHSSWRLDTPDTMAKHESSGMGVEGFAKHDRINQGRVEVAVAEVLEFEGSVISALFQMSGLALKAILHGAFFSAAAGPDLALPPRDPDFTKILPDFTLGRSAPLSAAL